MNKKGNALAVVGITLGVIFLIILMCIGGMARSYKSLVGVDTEVEQK